jgi:phytoene dehydrogenase-like protein
MVSSTPEIAVIGAGLSGLACARTLAKAGLRFKIYEASDGVGGRVRTDHVDGFRLDRGFQVFLPGYPAARKILDYDKLNLRPFFRGADVFHAGSLRRLADPLHHPTQAFRHLWDELVPWRDKWFTLLLRLDLRGVREVPRAMKEQKTEDFLRDFGFSDAFIDRFFRPFFGGIFTEKDLRTSSRMFAFLFAMFDRDGSTLPAAGMQSIPDQLAAGLPEESFRFQCPASAVAPGHLTLETGEVIKAQHIVLATSEDMAVRLLPHSGPTRMPHSRSLTCMYFATDQPLPQDPILCLDGCGRGPVNHACIVSNVSPDYAPEGQKLIAASILGAPSSTDLEKVVRDQMATWYGSSAHQWRHLRTYQIRNAQPESRQLKVGDTPASAILSPGLYQCGDYCEDVSINGAFLSGERAADAVIASSR